MVVMGDLTALNSGNNKSIKENNRVSKISTNMQKMYAYFDD